MFKLNYRIVESYERLREMDAATYDREWGNIEGLIELRFGESSVGYMYDGEITPEMYEVGCFQDELLVSWFRNLLDTVVALRESDYVTLCEIECPKIIEFCKHGEMLSVRECSEVFDQDQGSVDMELMGRPFLLKEEHKYIVQLRSGKHIEMKVKLSETDFKKVSILHREFEQEVLVKAIQFVDEVVSQYPWLMPSRTFTTLNERIENVRLLIN